MGNGEIKKSPSAPNHAVLELCIAYRENHRKALTEMRNDCQLISEIFCISGDKVLARQREEPSSMLLHFVNNGMFLLSFFEGRYSEGGRGFEPDG